MFKLLLTTVRDISLNGTSVHTLVIEFDDLQAADLAFAAIESNGQVLRSKAGVNQNVVKLY